MSSDETLQGIDCIGFSLEDSTERLHCAALTNIQKAVKSSKLSKEKLFTSKALVIVIALYLFSALVQSLLAVPANRLLGAAIALLLLYDYIASFTRLRAVLLMGLVLLFFVDACFMTNDLASEIEFYIYFSTTLLVMCFLCSDSNLIAMKSAIVYFQSFLRVSLLLVTIFIGLLLATHTGYNSHLGWGGSLYFRGFCNTPHTMASVCCLTMSLAFVSYKQNIVSKWATVVIFLIFTWALFQTGARVFLIPTAVLWILGVRNEIPQQWIRLSAYCFAAILIALIFGFTGMSEKFDFITQAANESSPITSFLNGRDMYWLTDLAAFADGDFVSSLFGSSASFVYDLNAKVLFMRIWSHNDFVMIICSAGIIGLLYYLCTMVAAFVNISKGLNSVVVALLAVFVFFPAIINGFYIYQHFVYAALFSFCAVAQNDNYAKRKNSCESASSTPFAERAI